MHQSKWVPFFRGDGCIVATTDLFPSEHSARWWHRFNCEEAVRAGALIKHRGLWFANPTKLAKVVEQIGRREGLRMFEPAGVSSSDLLSATPLVIEESK